MTITFVSNILSHWQKALSDELYSILGSNYKFVATQAINQERKKMKWKELKAPYLINLYSEGKVKEEIKDLMIESDVVIFGSASYSIIKERKRKNKLIIGYAERILKKGEGFFYFFPRYLKYHMIYSNKRKMYLLCSSAFTAYDFEKFGLLQGRRYKWGYFPNIVRHEDVDKLLEKKEKNSIVWAGRFVKWKHPEYAIEMARKLKNSYIDFKLYIVGDGENHIKEYLKKEIVLNGLSDNVILHGAMPPEQVRQVMENSEIFIFTSDRNEGWGVVLNEALNSCCAVVASNMIGSVPWLLEREDSGMVFDSGNINMLFSNVSYLLEHGNERKQMAKNGYLIIEKMWNPQVAAKRLIQLSHNLLENDYRECYEYGICSRADVIGYNWQNKRK